MALQLAGQRLEQARLPAHALADALVPDVGLGPQQTLAGLVVGDAADHGLLHPPAPVDLLGLGGVADGCSTVDVAVLAGGLDDRADVDLGVDDERDPAGVAVRHRPTARGRGNEHPLDLGGALTNLEDLGVLVEAPDPVLGHEAVAAEDLGGLAGGGDRLLGGVQLRDGGLALVGQALGLLPRGVPVHVAGGLRRDLHVRDLERDGLLLGDGLAERLTLAGVADALVDAALDQPDREGGDRDAAVVEGVEELTEARTLGERGAGFRQFLYTLDDGRIAISALAVGLIQGCVDECVRYAGEREAFGQPIAKQQAIAFKIADMEVAAQTARYMYWNAAWKKAEGLPYKREASIAKLYSSEQAVTAARQATQVFGGYGFMTEYRVGRFYQDAKILEVGEGTSEIQRMLISRDLGL